MWPFIHRAAPRAPSIGSVRFSFTPPTPRPLEFRNGWGGVGGGRPGRREARLRGLADSNEPERADGTRSPPGPGSEPSGGVPDEGRPEKNPISPKKRQKISTPAEPSRAPARGRSLLFFFRRRGEGRGGEGGCGGAAVRRRWARDEFPLSAGAAHDNISGAGWRAGGSFRGANRGCRGAPVLMRLLISPRRRGGGSDKRGPAARVRLHRPG